ncbi:hypothetical protein [Nitrospira sp. M1]
MKLVIRFSAIVFLSMILMVPFMTGCEQQGPAERAGEAVDEATEEAGEKLEEAGEEMEDAAN